MKFNLKFQWQYNNNYIILARYEEHYRESYNFLKYHRTVTIKENNLSLIEFMTDFLKLNSDITQLEIWSAQIDKNDALLNLYQALKINKTLKIIDLCQDNIDAKGAKYLADLLEYNDTLIDLNLSGNKLGPEGAQYLAVSLKNNNNLEKLSLCYNNIGDAGTSYFAMNLIKNNTLLALNLRQNNISTIGINSLQNLLKTNKTVSINLSYNQEKDITLFKEIKKHDQQSVKVFFQMIYQGIKYLSNEKLQEESDNFKQAIVNLTKAVEKNYDQHFSRPITLDKIFNSIKNKLPETKKDMYTLCIFKLLKLTVTERSENIEPQNIKCDNFNTKESQSLGELIANFEKLSISEQPSEICNTNMLGDIVKPVEIA